MTFTKDTREEQIFNALISRRTKFQVDGVYFTEKEIKGTTHEREVLCRKKAKELFNLIK